MSSRFKKGPGDCFDLVRNRLRHEQSVMRQETQADYLAYRLDRRGGRRLLSNPGAMGDRLDDLDDRTAAGEGQAAFAELHVVKRELLLLRRADLAAARRDPRTAGRRHAVHRQPDAAVSSAIATTTRSS